MMRGIKSNGKYPFGPFLIVVDRESYSLGEKCVVCKSPLFLEFLARHAAVAIDSNFSIVRADVAGRFEHLVEESFRLISLKKIPHKPLN